MARWLGAFLVPLHFTAPTDALGPDGNGLTRISPDPVRAYVFQQRDEQGTMQVIPGYADSLARKILQPHAPGTPEEVWLPIARDGSVRTIFVSSRDARGNTSGLSNGCAVTAALSAMPVAWSPPARTGLDVPNIEQEREHCGQAAVEMVLRYYGADPGSFPELARAYDPVLRGSLITDLAAAARRAGYDAAIATLTPDSLIALLNDGVPPILLYQGGSGPITFGHYGVVTGWDGTHEAFTMNDGTAMPHLTPRDELAKRWGTAGSQALIIRRKAP